MGSTVKDIEQPKLYKIDSNELTIAIASLSLGGAEKIVIDWASRIYPKWRVNLVVLRDRAEEWPVPRFVTVTRLHGKDLLEKLEHIGAKLASSPNPVCVCHLLTRPQRNALAKGGVNVVPVLHNARTGWLEDETQLSGSSSVIAVSYDCAESLKESDWRGSTSVIHHIPPRLKLDPKTREIFRSQWNIPRDATVIGMVGAVKPQKNYPLALQVLKSLLDRGRDVYLAIVGGPVNTPQGRPEWENLVEEVNRVGVRHRVAMPGFIPDASRCLPAFDMMLNTSHFEGLSIATLEALLQGIPVVASKVGGQGELSSEGLILIEKDSQQWADAVERALGLEVPEPTWANFPSHRLWTLAGLAHSVRPTGKVLFVAANLDSGGAQRSLVNLAKELSKTGLQFEITITANLTTDYFYNELQKSGVKTTRLCDPWDAFDFSENLVHKVCSENFDTVCFWNVNAMIKLLTVKALHPTNVKFVDVSPGDYLYGEMDDTVEFQELISFNCSEYFSRIDNLVLKFRGRSPKECEGRVTVIPNGVPRPRRVKKDYSIQGNPRIAVCGRIAPTKFDVEIIEAMKITWNTTPNAELHFFGAAESYHDQYMKMVEYHAGDEIDKRVFFHGIDFEAVSKLSDFDIFVVLGQNQGCPNALLEALSVGLPCIANDDGGTREQIIHNLTGCLMQGQSPVDLAHWISVLIERRDIAWLIGTKGREFVNENFSMKKMRRGYLEIFEANPSLTGRVWRYLVESIKMFVASEAAKKGKRDGTTGYDLLEQRLPR
jgi:glycosyltransferase involved in cell wall biosynthesis